MGASRFDEIKFMKEDAAAVEKQSEEIKARYCEAVPRVRRPLRPDRPFECAIRPRYKKSPRRKR